MQAYENGGTYTRPCTEPLLQFRNNQPWIPRLWLCPGQGRHCSLGAQVRALFQGKGLCQPSRLRLRTPAGRQLYHATESAIQNGKASPRWACKTACRRALMREPRPASRASVGCSTWTSCAIIERTVCASRDATWMRLEGGPLAASDHDVLPFLGAAVRTWMVFPQ